VPPPEELLQGPVLCRYLQGWGRKNDFAVVALDVEDGSRIGAAWYRTFPAHESGYGFVDEATPEIAIDDRVLTPLKPNEPVDLVNVFRNPNDIAPIVDACIALKLPRLWLQDGVVNEAEALRAQAAGIEVIMDRCIYRDYLALRKT